MSLIDLVLRGKRSASAKCQPVVEVLEVRQCLSVTAPTGLVGNAISSTQIKLTWNDVAGETGFNVYRWDGTQSVLAGSVGQHVTTFTVGSLPSNQTVYFSVKAHDLSTQAQSAWISVATLADAIAAPTNLHVTNITQTTMTLQWTNATGATSYNIYRWDGTRAILAGTTTPATPAFKVLNLTPGVFYYFYVQAVNNTNSASTGWVSAATTSAGLGKPTVTTQVIGSSTIALAWKNVNGETGYRVFIWNGNSNSSPTLLTTLAANTTGYQATGLLPGQTYWFYVQAFNATNSANSAWVSASTVAALPLQAPGQLTATVAGPTSVKVSWVEPARAVGYNVYYWTGLTWTLASSVLAGTHSVTVSGLPSNSTTWFYVQAYTANYAEIAYSRELFVNL
jgi:large repetitive protein